MTSFLPVPAMPAETQRRLDAAGRDLLLDALWQLAVTAARCEVTDLTTDVRDMAAQKAEAALAAAQANRRGTP